MTSHTNASRPDRRLRGVTLMEAVLYISIALALIVGGLLFYRQALTQSQFNLVSRSFAGMIAELRNVNDEIRFTTPIFNLEDVLYTRGAVPEELYDETRKAGQRFQFPFSTKLGATFGASFLANGQIRLHMILRNIDIRFCSRLLVVSKSREMVFSPDFFAGFVRDEFNASGVINLAPGFTPQASAHACKLADKNNNGMVWSELFFRF